MMKEHGTKIMILTVAWMLLAGGFTAVFNASAATFGTDQRVDDTGTAAIDQTAPDMAVDANNNIYVVWNDARNTNPWPNQDIFMAKSTNGGQSFGADKIVNTHNTNGTNPAIVTYGANDVYVVWQDDLNGNLDIFFTKSTDGGSTFASAVKVNDDAGTAEQSYPAIAVTKGGDICVVWQDFRNGNWDIFSSVSTDSGASWRTNARVNSNPSANVDQKFPDVKINGDDDIFVVWQDNRNGDDDIFIARSTNNGDSYQTDVKVNDGTNNEQQRYPVLAIDSSDTIFIAWEDYRNGNDWDIYLDHSTDSSGTTFDGNVKVNDNSPDNQRKPAITVDLNGGVHVAWYDTRGGNQFIYYTKSTDSGMSFGTDARACSTSAIAQSAIPPALGVSSNMNAFAAWSDFRNGNYDIYFSTGTNSQPSCTISAPASGATLTGTFTITGTATDPDGIQELARVEVRVDGGAWNTATGTASWSYNLNTYSLTNAQHTIEARAYDGHLFSTIPSVTVSVNNPSNLPPVVTIWTPSSGTTLSGTRAVIAGNTSDPDGNQIDFVQVRIDGGNWMDARGTNGWAAWVYSLDTTALADGIHTINARAFDGALYSDIASLSVFVENNNGNQAPAVTITKPLNGESISGNFIVEGTSSDPNGNPQVSKVEIRIDNGSWENAIPVAGSSNWTAWVYYLDIGSLSTGEHTITARAHDGIAYSTETAVTVNITAPSNGSNLALWILIIIIVVLIILLLLLLMKRNKDAAAQGPAQPEYEFQPAQTPQHPPQQPPYNQNPPAPPPEYPQS